MASTTPLSYTTDPALAVSGQDPSELEDLPIRSFDLDIEPEIEIVDRPPSPVPTSSQMVTRARARAQAAMDISASSASHAPRTTIRLEGRIDPDEDGHSSSSSFTKLRRSARNPPASGKKAASKPKPVKAVPKTREKAKKKVDTESTSSPLVPVILQRDDYITQFPPVDTSSLSDALSDTQEFRPVSSPLLLYSSY